ncbi:MAG: S9 family peptidase, partial [Idiomarina sp.]
MRMVLTAVAASVLMACSPQQSAEQAQEPQTEQQAQQESAQMQYPETRKGDVVDTYFETEIADPYRWLEDDRSEETENWVKAQNEVTFDHLENIPFREKIEARLTELWNYEKVSAPRFEGDYIYFYKNDGLQNQYVVYRKKSEDAEAEVFLDPNTFSEDGTTSLAQLTFSEDGSIAAYSISEGGSDWRKIIVIDAETGEQLEEPLVDVKFSGISWKGNDGFYYSSYDKPEGSELSAKTDQHKLYYHELGTAQSDDQLIFGGTEEEKHRYVGGYVTEDDRFLVVSAANSTSGNTLYIKDLSDPDADLVLVDGNMDYDTSVLTSRDSTLYLETNMDAPNGRVVTVNASNPQPENWQDFIAHSDNVLNPSTGAGYIFAEYMVDAVSKVEQYDYDGNKVRDIELPGVGSASGFSEKQDAEKVFYSFTNYSTPQTIYEMNPDTGESLVYEESGADFDSSQYVSKQVFYTSKDGTKVPMIITHKKGMALDGSNPTILYGYGGFNISLTPSFSIANAAWLEMGGVYAVANLRGGGEYGKEWHKAGTKMQKQNVFDDFIAAGEYLIDEDYTSSERLAVRGGSNGGLLVGAVMTQRPELFAVALPAVGVLDMLRYHTFTAGAGWAYGCRRR